MIISSNTNNAIAMFIEQSVNQTSRSASQNSLHHDSPRSQMNGNARLGHDEGNFKYLFFFVEFIRFSSSVAIMTDTLFLKLFCIVYWFTGNKSVIPD